ncbi:MAG: hypothetical protein QOD06_1342 [Candidatus Binatota bacterium]|jgi:hypothetical protein|nr:hypothetical protein [Candidatus Binatota bacterium]
MRAATPSPRRRGVATRTRRRFLVTFTGVASLLGTVLYAGQPLETETARLLPAGGLKTEATFEYQTSPDGKEYDLPFAFEYGITDRLEILVEPVWVTAIRPSSGRGATGFGDLEMTLSYLVLRERTFLPAIAPAFEIKIPTASDDLIGTGEPDERFLLIASKRFGAFDTHVNLGYTVVGSPQGASLKNVFDYAFAIEYNLLPTVDLVAEVLGNTASSPEGDTAEGTGGPAENAIVPEAAGTEVSGLVGFRYYVRPNLFLSLGGSYDNNDAFLVRPGITWELPLEATPF